MVLSWEKENEREFIAKVGRTIFRIAHLEDGSFWLMVIKRVAIMLGPDLPAEMDRGTPVLFIENLLTLEAAQIAAVEFLREV